MTLNALVLAAALGMPAAEPNPAIDVESHLRLAHEAARHREARRVDEAEFLRMSREPGTIVLDARSREKFDELHVKGAVNLSFPDFNARSLRSLLGKPGTRVLIYCNNNFAGAEDAFPRKIATMALNLSTYEALYGYGYRNVYELAPLVDVRTTTLELTGSSRQRQR